MRDRVRFGSRAALLLLSGALLSCSGDKSTPTEAVAVDDGAQELHRHRLSNTSVTPAFLKRLPQGVTAYSLISSDDTLPESPDYVFGGSADGAGFLDNGDGTFTVVVNHEDNFAVSRLTLDRSLKPVKGEYLINSSFGLFRLCSATLATPEEHGFGPLYLTAGESGPESQIHAIDPYGAPNSNRFATGLGQWSTENAVPLPRQAYRGKTVIVLGDDDSGPFGGQLVLYVSDRVGDLDNGKLYALAYPEGITRERQIELGHRYPVQFKQIENQRELRAGGLNEAAAALNAIAFGRVEDIDYRKQAFDVLGRAGREVYFIVTGQNNTDVNADYGRSKYGRVYRLRLHPFDPTRGTLEVLLDGDDRGGPAGKFQNPDNIVVTEDYAYIKEDPNGYGDETHDSYIWQYDLDRGGLSIFAELDHRRDQPDAAKYNGSTPSRFGSWEYGAMIDISRETGARPGLRPSRYVPALYSAPHLAGRPV